MASLRWNSRGSDVGRTPLGPNVRTAHGHNLHENLIPLYTLPPQNTTSPFNARNPNVFNTPYTVISLQSKPAYPKLGQRYDWFRAPSLRNSRVYKPYIDTGEYYQT